ncbi:hypothetical protein [Marinobacter shengliensis]|uniref:hypothetical protein n=1 Tax=Marinobacter shengliensis TaxID=1389223 RepID=UPI0025722B84|nr:hypothetical protein [Marinobacter shengliensis]BEH13261.1 hypothetical protein MAALD49_06290 [Marinobacter shengliensis]
MSNHMKALEAAKAKIAELEGQVDDHKQRAHDASQELQQLEKREAEAGRVYQATLNDFAAGKVAEIAVDDAEQRVEEIRTEIEKRRPRLSAVIEASKATPVSLVREIMQAETAARAAIASYWREQRDAIEKQALEVLPLLKLWQEVCHVDAGSRVDSAQLPPLEMPLSPNAVTSNKIFSTDRDRARRGE